MMKLKMKSYKNFGSRRLDTKTLVKLSAIPSLHFEISSEAIKTVRKDRKVVDEILKTDQIVYGINTGFGFLSDVKIEKDQLEQLQINLIRSHACGVGAPIEAKFVRALLISRAYCFLQGHTGVRLETIELMLKFIEHDILPVIPCQGSVGASGDLAPLAHLALGLIGEGMVDYLGDRMEAKGALEKAGLTPLKPAPKEGLSLINGTQFMTVFAAFAIEYARNIIKTADVACALSLDAFLGTVTAYQHEIHDVRPQKGQIKSALNMQRMLSAPDDEIMQSHKNCNKVQDPYSFRCAPQVHGACRDAFKYAKKIVNIELKSVTDNPLIFGDKIISGGNFHGEPIAMAMDFLSIALSEIGSISECRIEKLNNPAQSQMPAFIAKDTGLNSGFMIPHVVAASLASENKTLSHPACVDSIPTSADKEDHVSMGAFAARKVHSIIHNVSHILAIEFLCAQTALALKEPLKPGTILSEVLSTLELVCDPMLKDRSLSEDIESVAEFVRLGYILSNLKYNVSFKIC